MYLEGDGRPWVTPISMASDPTPKSALIPTLMAIDTAPALYLGRPCYFDTHDQRCNDHRWWTSHRYSQEVISSLNRVIDRFNADYTQLALIGHSGGGTLAHLIASQRQDVIALVTLAGNLDPDHWARHHGFTPLSGSLNPADTPQLDANTTQRHYLGDRDTVITRAMFDNYLKRHPAAQLSLLPEIDHRCCWEDRWPAILRWLSSLEGR